MPLRAYVRLLGAIVCAGIIAKAAASIAAGDTSGSALAGKGDRRSTFTRPLPTRPAFRLSNGRAAPPPFRRMWPGELEPEHPDYPRSYRAWVLRGVPTGSETFLEREPHDASELSLRGVARHKLGQVTEAESDLSRAVKLDGRSAGLRLNRAAFYVQVGRWQEALADLAVAQATEPRHPALYHLEAEALCGLGRWPEAKLAIVRAMALDPTDPDHWLRRAAIHLRQGKLTAWGRDMTRARALRDDAEEFRRTQNPFSWLDNDLGATKQAKGVAPRTVTPAYPKKQIPMVSDADFLGQYSFIPVGTGDHDLVLSMNVLRSWLETGAKATAAQQDRHLLSLESREAFVPPYQTLTAFVVVPECEVIEGVALLVSDEPGWQTPVRSFRQVPFRVEELTERDGAQTTISTS